MTIFNKSQRQAQRIKAKIKKLIATNKALFLTLTFNENTLKKTTAKTRERYIKKYLKENTAVYIANKDYGKDNKREHYHAIVLVNTIKPFEPTNELYQVQYLLNIYAYKYGAIDSKFIKVKTDTLKQTTENLFKHSFKESTNESNLIYSRKEPTEQEQIKRLERFLNIRERISQLNMLKTYGYADNNYIEKERKKIIKNDINFNDLFILNTDYNIANEEPKEKPINEESNEEENKEIKHPKEFYYIWEKELIFKPIKKINDNCFLYKATNYDLIKMQFITRERLYNQQSDIFKAYTKQIKNESIIFID